MDAGSSWELFSLTGQPVFYLYYQLQSQLQQDAGEAQAPEE